MHISNLFRKRENKYSLSIQPANENQLLITINPTSCYFLYPLLSHLLEHPAVEYKSPVTVVTSEDTIHSQQQSKKDFVSNWIFSLQLLPITLQVSLPPIALMIKKKKEYVKFSLEEFNCSGKIVIDFMGGFSLSDVLKLHAKFCIADQQNHSDSTVVQIELSPSMKLMFHMSSLQWDIAYSSLLLLLETLRFGSLLPSNSNPSSLIREKYVIFGMKSKQKYRLREELARQAHYSCRNLHFA